ncbi:FGGY family carbohydrate kinase [Maribacter sp. MAR_2009_72]|uniref:FGGY family carbohydrate kinase n=1 Tax=Maribacter sp. MAR_2009_72 TaxID=1250050 RepID=UPI00119C047F|nr:glycerol kinase GlpK [Maribacter sp. MAR_2009_72]TVZ16664.1 glycerol kinase [Maribacter sp. MAR_2009_72]
MTASYILSVDQGTSGTKAIIFDVDGNIIVKAFEPLRSYYPSPGFVEQDPEEIYQNVLTAVKNCYSKFLEELNGADYTLLSCGISNQRETFVVWDSSGKPLYNAVVWQCKRSADICDELKRQGLEEMVNSKTGLTIDPYFSATKMIWLVDHVPAVSLALQRKDAFFGTIDTWLLHKLSGHQHYATDHTNASRTLLYNTYNLRWDDELLSKFGLINLNLPKVQNSAYKFGTSDFNGIFHEKIPITGIIGDSHAAFFGEECFEIGMAKATMGTGSSMLWNTGGKAEQSGNGILTTVGWSLPNQLHFALEGVIVSCGATLEWLKNQLGLFAGHEQIEALATSVSSNEGVYLIPAFSGIGAPHWQKDWKASIHGITFGTTKAHFVRAALESIAYQIKDVVLAIEQETGQPLRELRVDGGITANGFLMQFLANVLQTPVTNIGITDVSARGAALIAGMGAEYWKEISDLPKASYEDFKKYEPKILNKDMVSAYETWQRLLINKKE